MTAPVKRMQLMASIVSAPLRATCRELRNFLPCWRELGGFKPTANTCLG